MGGINPKPRRFERWAHRCQIDIKVWSHTRGIKTLDDLRRCCQEENLTFPIDSKILELFMEKPLPQVPAKTKPQKKRASPSKKKRTTRKSSSISKKKIMTTSGSIEERKAWHVPAAERHRRKKYAKGELKDDS